MKTERDCLEIINSGEDTAYGLLYDADPKLIRKFKAVDKAIVDYLAEVQKHFPDACYYTASGGFSLMLGRTHGDNEEGQQELVAMSGNASIHDGDF